MTEPPIQKVEKAASEPIHPSWLEFIRYCRHLQHDEIDRLIIQNGLPVLAELTRQKIKFNQRGPNSPEAFQSKFGGTPHASVARSIPF